MPRVVALPKEDLEILDTWHTLGLRGTGSHDAVADEVFVPARARVLAVRRPGRWTARCTASRSSGSSRSRSRRPRWATRAAAIDDLVALAAGKVGLGSTRTLAERAPTQASVAAAEASLRAARALYYEAIEAAWAGGAGATSRSPVALRTGLRLAATHAVRTSAEVVRSMYDLAGGTAIYDDSPLQRRFRDAHTATAHFQVNEASRELPGRILLGQPADTAML